MIIIQTENEAKIHAVTVTVGRILEGLLLDVEGFAGSLTIQGWSRSSDADGRKLWSSSNVLFRKSSASTEISEGNAGFAEEPICPAGI